MSQEITPVQFGYAEVDITSDWPVALVGFSRIDNTSKGILHRLNVQVLLCKTNVENCCLITIDSIGFTVALTNTLRDLVAKQISGLRENVMVFFSHTHAAPNAGLDKKYYSLVCNQILWAVRNAEEKMVPLNVAWGITNTSIGINRRRLKYR